MHMDPFTHDAYKETYIEYKDFEEGDTELDYHL